MKRRLQGAENRAGGEDSVAKKKPSDTAQSATVSVIEGVAWLIDD